MKLSVLETDTGVTLDTDIPDNLLSQRGRKGITHYEKRRENLSLGLWTRSYTNWAVPPLKMVRGSKFWI